MKVRKAVIPVAGLGTRFLPATKGIPKELFPLLNKPVLLYLVEEAVQSGIEEIIFVTHPTKAAIEEFFQPSPHLEKELKSKKKTDLLATIERLHRLAEFRSVLQTEPKGLGHAVLCAETAVGHEDFAVILPDDPIDHPTPCLQQMLQAFPPDGHGMVAVMPVPREQSVLYGMVGFSTREARLLRLTGVIEKPAPEQSPSTYAVVGRYLLPAATFEILKSLPPGRLGEIQLADAIDQLAKTGACWGYEFEGERFDAGDVLGFVMANIHFGLKDPALQKPLKEFLRKKA